MSSRALRKAQRLRDEKSAQLAESQNDSTVAEDDGTGETQNEFTFSNLKSNQISFGMLRMDDEDENQDPESQSDDKDDDISTRTQEASSMPNSSKRKKKKNKKRKAESLKNELDAQQDGDLDEIDRALQSLSKISSKVVPNTTEILPDASQIELQKLLSIDSQLLNPINEMKRLFGNAAIGTNGDDDNVQGGGRRRGREGQQVGLAGMVAGRNTGNKSLAGLGLRRNVFVQGKEEWPKATGGGLGMELVERRENGTVEYKYVHNGAYQDVQRQFDQCVRSMDPQRMVQLLQHNPYHISTLLQVSEIAKVERDHSTSGVLLERALFSFGRAVHSTFSKSMSEGKARLDFRRPENREFWLAAFRYIINLGMRGTWRTAFEWTKLMLSLDPEHDPYEISLIIDQLALRARQAQQFISLNECELLKSKYLDYPNIQVSRGLAYYQVKDSNKCRSSLEFAISKFPWVFSRLFQELEISHVPPSIWGAEPKTDREKLLSELYVTRAVDLWKTPEAIAMLTGIVEHVKRADYSPSPDQVPISLDEARHTLLTDTPALISILPHSLSGRVTSSSDPLPPEDEIKTYVPAYVERIPSPIELITDPVRQIAFLRGILRSVIPRPDVDGDDNSPANLAARETFFRNLDPEDINSRWVHFMMRATGRTQEEAQEFLGTEPANGEEAETGRNE